MYITVSKQQQGETFSGSVRDFVNYLEKENEDNNWGQQEHFFDQDHDRIPAEEVIREIDNNASKLNKRDPKFYSMVVSPSQRELKTINNDPEKLRLYIREMMKDYAASFYRNSEVTVNDIKYYAKIEKVRTYKGKDREIRENQPYATKILEIKNQMGQIERGEIKGDVKNLKRQIEHLERDAPHKINGQRIVRGMKKEGLQTHVHIIVSHKDATNSFKLSPLSQHRAAETILNGSTIKMGFSREKFYEAAEKTYDRTFRHRRKFMESYKTRNVLDKDPKRFLVMLAGLPMSEKQIALKTLYKAGVNVPTLPTNEAQLAYRALMKLKRGIEIALNSGSIGI